jgi:hypothetical protein
MRIRSVGRALGRVEALAPRPVGGYVLNTGVVSHRPKALILRFVTHRMVMVMVVHLAHFRGGLHSHAPAFGCAARMHGSDMLCAMTRHAGAARAARRTMPSQAAAVTATAAADMSAARSTAATTRVAAAGVIGRGARAHGRPTTRSPA